MLLELKNIRKTYFSQKTERIVLDQIDLAIDHGDALSIVGPSGCGKSTLLNIMGTMDQPDTGDVILDGTHLDGLNNHELAVVRNQRIGFIFQQHHLLPHLTLLENTLVPLIPVKDKKKREQGRYRAMELIDWIGLSELTHQFPHQLSVGECQRTAIVRALVNEPDLLLADEPTGSLDEENAEKLVDLLMRINRERGLTLVMVTHALELTKKIPVNYGLTKGRLRLLSQIEKNE
jgi:ABC-type lipoprotein export system ATPase subunit